MVIVEPPADFLRGPEDPRDAPDQGLIEVVRYALWFARELEQMLEPDTPPEEALLGYVPPDLLAHGYSAYAVLRRVAHRTPALSDHGMAAKAALTLYDMDRVAIRASNDQGGMALLALTEDLIAKII